jgi:hypothetical protein
MLKTIVLGTALGAALVCAPALADPLTGTFGFDIYQGSGNGVSTDPNNQADLANPLINQSNLIAQVIYNGPINFNASQNSVLSFFNSAGGTILGSDGNLNAILSSGNYGTTTVFTMFGSTAENITGTISHDDGASLYDANLNAVFSSPSPTVDIDGSYALDAGAFELVYVEANGLPSVLDVDVATETPVPEPASWAVFGVGLLGLTVVARGRKRA